MMLRFYRQVARQTSFICHQMQAIGILFLVDPVVLSQLVLKHFVLVEPQSNLFLRALDGVGAMADVAANILRYNQPRS